MLDKEKQIGLLRSINAILVAKYGYQEETLMTWWTHDNPQFTPNPLEYAKDNNHGLHDMLGVLSGNQRG